MSKFLVCICGWISEAYENDAIIAGPGGEFVCPECADAKRNKGIEGWGRDIIVNEKTFWRIIAAKDRLAFIRELFEIEQRKDRWIWKINRHLKR